MEFSIEQERTKDSGRYLEQKKAKRLIPKKLTFNEVSTYVKLCERIYDYRYRVQLENTRLRMARSRRKMKAAAKKGNPLKKQLSKSVKKSNKETISQKRKRIRSDPTSN